MLISEESYRRKVAALTEKRTAWLNKHSAKSKLTIVKDTAEREMNVKISAAREGVPPLSIEEAQEVVRIKTEEHREYKALLNSVQAQAGKDYREKQRLEREAAVYRRRVAAERTERDLGPLTEAKIRAAAALENKTLAAIALRELCAATAERAEEASQQKAQKQQEWQEAKVALEKAPIKGNGRERQDKKSGRGSNEIVTGRK
jgi:hypothetical protein